MTPSGYPTEKYPDASQTLTPKFMWKGYNRPWDVL